LVVEAASPSWRAAAVLCDFRPARTSRATASAGGCPRSAISCSLSRPTKASHHWQWIHHPLRTPLSGTCAAGFC